MIDEKYPQLFCANCGQRNESNRINIMASNIWLGLYQRITCVFTCHFCGALHDMDIQSKDYQNDERRREMMKR